MLDDGCREKIGRLIVNRLRKIDVNFRIIICQILITDKTNVQCHTRRLSVHPSSKKKQESSLSECVNYSKYVIFSYFFCFINVIISYPCFYYSRIVSVVVSWVAICWWPITWMHMMRCLMIEGRRLSSEYSISYIEHTYVKYHNEFFAFSYVRFCSKAKISKFLAVFWWPFTEMRLLGTLWNISHSQEKLYFYTCSSI